ncbi:hypothetical protein LJR153_007323 [Paenibacillus sp. LjRoot153]|uniref:hypothetical protein n=1 Tax=Paenibacillus sp. LjRoot153 TaxID=3342270 RepID=UPI003ECFE3CF
MVLAKLLLAESLNERLEELPSVVVHEFIHQKPFLENIESLPFINERSTTFILELNILFSEDSGEKTSYRIRLLHSIEGKIYILLYCGTREKKSTFYYSEVKYLQDAWNLVEKHLFSSERTARDGGNQ